MIITRVDLRKLVGVPLKVSGQQNSSSEPSFAWRSAALFPFVPECPKTYSRIILFFVQNIYCSQIVPHQFEFKRVRLQGIYRRMAIQKYENIHLIQAHKINSHQGIFRSVYIELRMVNKWKRSYWHLELVYGQRLFDPLSVFLGLTLYRIRTSSLNLGIAQSFHSSMNDMERGFSSLNLWFYRVERVYHLRNSSLLPPQNTSPNIPYSTRFIDSFGILTSCIRSTSSFNLLFQPVVLGIHTTLCDLLFCSA